jgi:putative lipoic acid-binding regulatory protein
MSGFFGGPTTEASFRERLDGYYDWPCSYLFKFIVPKDQVDQVLDLFDDGVEVTTRESKRGNYVSVTAEVEMGSSEEVVGLYRRAGEIDGVMPL